jgi:[protein-PII] uridylyltransferase
MTTATVNPREIIDRRRLLDDLRGVAKAEGTERRTPFAERLKTTYRAGYDEIRRRFEEGGSGTVAVREHCFLMDQLVRALHDFVTQHVYPLANPTKGEHLSIVAVGGYGRGELAPHSDVDLLFLLPYKPTPYTEQVIEYILYTLWDLGLKVGHSARSVDECLRQAKADLTIRTALLEARWVWGEQGAYDELRRRFDAEIAKDAVAFVEAKLGERDQRHQKLGDSRYVLEPNIKEGKGGLRDLHTLFWIAKYIYHIDDVAKLLDLKVLSAEEHERFERAQNFLWTVRCHLHYLAGRPEDRLTFDMQAAIAPRMGYTDHAGTRGVERVMKHYFLVAKDVGDLTRIFCAVLEAEQQRTPRWKKWATKKRSVGAFVVAGGRVNVARESAFRDDPVNFLRLFSLAQEEELDIHPNALRLVTQSLKLVDATLRDNEEANRLFMEILTSRKDPETALRRMNEAGVFGRFIPDFGRVVAQMQYDMYHVYTVDEHTIRAIGILSKIEAGALVSEAPVATAVVQEVLSRRALYLAVFLHDIAKGRGGDHSEIGEKVALKLGPRVGLTAEETEQVSWLVRWHLLMSNTAFKRDIDDPQTIRDFVEKVQSPERLKLLLVLTVADIRAVGPKTWNGWKAALLRELYHRAIELMSGGQVAAGRDARVAAAHAAARALLPDFSEPEFQSFVASSYPFYWLSFDPETHARHARLVREATRSEAPLSVDKRIDVGRSVTEVTLYTADHPGLFSRIAGALALSGANIVDARIITMANGMALDTFWVQDASGGPFERPDKLAKLAVVFENVLSGRLKPHVELKRPAALSSRTTSFPVTPRVLIDNKASLGHTIIEINGRDRPGLLFELTRALTSLNLQISSAKISTYGEKVVDVFYVKNLFGHKVDHDAKVRQIREALLEILLEPDPTPFAEARRPRRRTAEAAE